MDTPFKITITPKIGGETKLYTTPKVYHSTQDDFDPKKEIFKTFYLSTDSEKDDIIIIELSSCSGMYLYKINEIQNGRPTENKVKYSSSKDGGREIITIQDLKSRNYENVKEVTYKVIYQNKKEVFLKSRMEQYLS